MCQRSEFAPVHQCVRGVGQEVGEEAMSVHRCSQGRGERGLEWLRGRVGVTNCRLGLFISNLGGKGTCPLLFGVRAGSPLESPLPL